MQITQTLYVKNRQEWRNWLEVNFQTSKEIWLIFPERSLGKPALIYNDAVEEALAFGWIDSTSKRIEGGGRAQRFSPRNPRSPYSQANKERLKWLLEEGLVHPSIRQSIKKVVAEEFVFPPDIIEAIQANPQAWKNYQKFSAAYRRIRVAYIDGARDRPEEFKKRLANFIKKTEQNKMIGYGGIEKYY